MTTKTAPALHLRRLIADVYLTDHPPPGLDRATWFTTALARDPDSPEYQSMARDFLAVVGLYRRLTAARDRADDPTLGLVIDGLISDASAELMGATRDPGWRAAALDLLEPDGEIRPPLDHDDAVQLFALALGLDESEEEPPDGAAGS